MTLHQFDELKKSDVLANINTTKGTIKVKLFPNIAPLAVENFLTLAKNGYYDNVIFHRVINDFMIQTGDPEGTGMGGNSIWNKPFKDEFDLYYRNFRGALSMANAGPNTNGSQFFIVQKNNTEPKFIEQMREMGEENGYPENIIDAYEKFGGTFWLDFKHTVFGHVYSGMDIVDEIATTRVGINDKPIEEIKINDIEIL
ncbi:peptidylprolyl isomerase [Miniphocaeibacter halophilus]|uniref:Peptidylprolyl isomerase n=1 Tax=Miniphocaeibacter halophilus TaxID=2931922 RepID=A0AC61NHW9_9FIRM|nr:peptidylprolyl isomerase [Miniphocaeibacter halophilus]